MDNSLLRGNQKIVMDLKTEKFRLLAQGLLKVTQAGTMQHAVAAKVG